MIAPGMRRILVGLVLGAGILVGGCNVFSGLGAEPNTVEELLAEARAALSAGESGTAVRLLERALDKDSTDVRVRVELGNALYSDRDLDLFAFREAAEHLAEDPDSSAAAGSSTAHPGVDRVCTAGADPETSSDRYTSISVEAAAIDRLVGRRALIDRVHSLIVEGTIEQRSGALNEAAARLRRKAFLVGAATVFMRGSIGLRDAILETESTLYFDRQVGPHGAILACAPSDSALDRAHEALCDLGAEADRAVRWLDARAELSGGTRTKDLVQWLQRVDRGTGARAGCT